MELAHGEPRAEELLQQSLEELFQRGWLAGEKELRVTDAGREHLGRWL
jgi:hypothetical protein